MDEIPLPCPYSNGTRCEQSEIWRSYEIAVDRVTENWIAERHRREEIEAAFKAAQQRIAELEREQTQRYSVYKAGLASTIHPRRVS